jgi:hypothetical protein
MDTIFIDNYQRVERVLDILWFFCGIFNHFGDGRKECAYFLLVLPPPHNILLTLPLALGRIDQGAKLSPQYMMHIILLSLNLNNLGNILNLDPFLSILIEILHLADLQPLNIHPIDQNTTEGPGQLLGASTEQQGEAGQSEREDRLTVQHEVNRHEQFGLVVAGLQQLYQHWAVRFAEGARRCDYSVLFYGRH